MAVQLKIAVEIHKLQSEMLINDMAFFRGQFKLWRLTTLQTAAKKHSGASLQLPSIKLFIEGSERRILKSGGHECKSWWTELLKLNKWKHSEPWEVRCLETTKIGAPGVQISLGATMNKTWSALSLALFLLSLSLCSFLSVSVSIHWALLAWQITLHLDCHSGSRQAF